jgi:hypothetical protein
MPKAASLLARNQDVVTNLPIEDSLKRRPRILLPRHAVAKPRSSPGWLKKLKLVQPAKEKEHRTKGDKLTTASCGSQLPTVTEKLGDCRIAPLERRSSARRKPLQVESTSEVRPPAPAALKSEPPPHS